MQNSILTDRLFLDIITKEDDGFIIQLVNSRGWIDYIGDRNIHTKKDAIAYIEKILASENFFIGLLERKTKMFQSE